MCVVYFDQCLGAVPKCWSNYTTDVVENSFSDLSTSSVLLNGFIMAEKAE